MVESQARYFDALYDVARAVNSTLHAEEVLSTIVKAATEATNAKGCCLLLLDDEKKRLVHSADYGLSDNYIRKGELLADRSLADTLKGEPVAVTDVSSDPRIQYPAEAAQEGIGSLLCVPLAARNVTIGEMRIYRAEKQDFPADMVKLLTAIANLSAIAIDNSRIHESLKKAHDVCRMELWHWQP
ncbi:MAG: GAF domain-containing protein [Dehalococcoidia bacterium]